MGIGIEGVVKKLEKDYDMKISKWVHLRDKAREKGVFGEIASNCSVEKLAKKVLGEEWDVNNHSLLNSIDIVSALFCLNTRLIPSFVTCYICTIWYIKSFTILFFIF